MKLIREECPCCGRMEAYFDRLPIVVGDREIDEIRACMPCLREYRCDGYLSDGNCRRPQEDADPGEPQPALDLEEILSEEFVALTADAESRP